MAGETGFPSPAQGYEATTFNLNDSGVLNPPPTFCMRMKGRNLASRGILSEDLLVVDRSRPPVAGCFVVFRSDSDFACRELVREGERFALADGEGNRVAVSAETEIFGTVTGVVRHL